MSTWQCMALLLGVFLLIGMWIGWECWGRPLKRYSRDIANAARYKDACRDLLTWCGQEEFRPARLVAAHIMAIGEGEGLNAGTPCGYEACTVDGLREQLRRMNSMTPLTRQQIDNVMTEHYPLSSLLRQEVDAFEVCVRDIERLHGIDA